MRDIDKIYDALDDAQKEYTLKINLLNEDIKVIQQKCTHNHATTKKIGQLSKLFDVCLDCDFIFGFAGTSFELGYREVNGKITKNGYKR